MKSTMFRCDVSGCKQQAEVTTAPELGNRPDGWSLVTYHISSRGSQSVDKHLCPVHTALFGQLLSGEIKHAG